MIENRPALHLCGGLQSSGSTLVSWCFLQRADMNGVLDADNDILMAISPEWGTPLTWYKTTISCFRLTELKGHFQDDGWDVRPILVVRDVRRVWASLAKKAYGRNGTTAEDPPLRMRLKRFREDWEVFRARKWPIVRYESLVSDPVVTLAEACRQLKLPWDEAMVNWPKDAAEIADTRHGNRTFRDTRGTTLIETVKSKAGPLVAGQVPAEDLRWLDKEFAEFNQANGYPPSIPTQGIVAPGDRAVPSYRVSRRYKWELRRKPIRWFLAGLGKLSAWN